MSRHAVCFTLLVGAMLTVSGCSDKPESKPAPKSATPPAAPKGTAEPGVPNPSVNAAPANAAGHDLYLNHCASCHGKSGRGDGPMAQFLATPPRGLVIEPWRTFPAASDAEERAGLESVVRQGFPDRGMPAYSKRLGEDEIKAIVDQVLAMRGAAKGG